MDNIKYIITSKIPAKEVILEVFDTMKEAKKFIKKSYNEITNEGFRGTMIEPSTEKDGPVVVKGFLEEEKRTYNFKSYNEMKLFKYKLKQIAKNIKETEL